MCKCILFSNCMKNGTGKNFFQLKKITIFSFFLPPFSNILTDPKPSKIQIFFELLLLRDHWNASQLSIIFLEASGNTDGRPKLYQSIILKGNDSRVFALLKQKNFKTKGGAQKNYFIKTPRVYWDCEIWLWWGDWNFCNMFSANLCPKMQYIHMYYVSMYSISST